MEFEFGKTGVFMRSRHKAGGSVYILLNYGSRAADVTCVHSVLYLLPVDKYPDNVPTTISDEKLQGTRFPRLPLPSLKVRQRALDSFIQSVCEIGWVALRTSIVGHGLAESLSDAIRELLPANDFYIPRIEELASFAGECEEGDPDWREIARQTTTLLNKFYRKQCADFERNTDRLADAIALANRYALITESIGDADRNNSITIEFKKRKTTQAPIPTALDKSASRVNTLRKLGASWLDDVSGNSKDVSTVLIAIALTMVVFNCFFDYAGWNAESLQACRAFILICAFCTLLVALVPVTYYLRFYIQLYRTYIRATKVELKSMREQPYKWVASTRIEEEED